MQPKAEQKVNFLRKFSLAEEGWTVGVVNLAVLVCNKDDDRKKVNFSRKKVHPPEKSWLCLSSKTSLA